MKEVTTSMGASAEGLYEAVVERRGHYEDGSSSVRTTYFVYENGEWKHRFGEEEMEIFMLGVPYEEFVAAQS